MSIENGTFMSIERVLHRALAKGGEFAEIFAEDRRQTAAVLDDRRVEDLSSGADRGAGIRVVAGETTGYAYTSDLSERGLLEAAEAASAIASEGKGGTRIVHVGNSNLQGGSIEELLEAAGDLSPRRSSPLDPQGSAMRMLPETVSKADKVNLLLRADDAARSAGGAIAQVTISYADSHRRIVVANSDGLVSGDDQVRTRFIVSCVAIGDSGMQTGYDTAGKTVGFELFNEVDVEDVAGNAARIALAKLDARPAPTGVVPVVIKAGSGGILFHEACGHGLEADHILKNSSVYTNKIGERVASSLVTLVDDGGFGDEWGSYAIDDEGHPAQRNVLIAEGVLTDYMWDFLRARKEGRTSSGNGRRQSYRHLPMVRMTNTFLLNGEDDEEAIIEEIPFGVYVAKLGGGQVDTASGDFVFGMSEAYLIERGKVGGTLRDANLIGNGPEVLQRIDAVAGDFAMTQGTCGKDGQSVPVGCGQPTLRISGITIGGTANA